MEPKRAPKQGGLYQILFIVILEEYKKSKQCKNATKVDVEGAFLQSLGKFKIDNLLCKNDIICTEVISCCFIAK